MATANKEAAARRLSDITSNFKLKPLNSLERVADWLIHDFIWSGKYINSDLREVTSGFSCRFLLQPDETWKAEESLVFSFLPAAAIHPRSNQRLPSCQTKPGTAGWSIPDKGSEVRAVKRLLTSHFICQTFISLFMVQCTPSVRAMLHTCAWNTFRAPSATLHDLTDRQIDKQR